MNEQCIEKVKLEIKEIDTLIERYSVLIEAVRIKEPDLIEMTAMATVLHSFYSGIEKIFVIIAKDIDKSIPSGIKWHKDILIQMTKSNLIRRRVISDDILELLNEYLGFRHFYRHAYSFQLSWDKLEGLAVNIIDVWGKVKVEIEGFLETL